MGIREGRRGKDSKGVNRWDERGWRRDGTT